MVYPGGQLILARGEHHQRDPQCLSRAAGPERDDSVHVLEFPGYLPVPNLLLRTERDDRRLTWRDRVLPRHRGHCAGPGRHRRRVSFWADPGSSARRCCPSRRRPPPCDRSCRNAHRCASGGDRCRHSRPYGNRTLVKLLGIQLAHERYDHHHLDLGSRHRVVSRCRCFRAPPRRCHRACPEPTRTPTARTGDGLRVWNANAAAARCAPQSRYLPAAGSAAIASGVSARGVAPSPSCSFLSSVWGKRRGWHPLLPALRKPPQLDRPLPTGRTRRFSVAGRDGWRPLAQRACRDAIISAEAVPPYGCTDGALVGCAPMGGL